MKDIKFLSALVLIDVFCLGTTLNSGTEHAWVFTVLFLALGAMGGALAVGALEQRTAAIRKVAEELEDYCDQAEDASYGTLSTRLIRGYARTLHLATKESL